MDTYDFKLQCSGVWQSYMDLTFSGEKLKASKECPAGTMAFGWRSFRGFVRKGDRDSYEFELNCKSAAQSLSALRAMPNVQELGLSVGRIEGSNPRHRERVGDTLTHGFCGSTLPWNSKMSSCGRSTATRPKCLLDSPAWRPGGSGYLYLGAQPQLVPKARGWPLSTIRHDVATWLGALGLGEVCRTGARWPDSQIRGQGGATDAFCLSFQHAEAFKYHNLQGDVIFLLLESHLQEMGMKKIGDRLYFMEVRTQPHTSAPALLVRRAALCAFRQERQSVGHHMSTRTLWRLAATQVLTQLHDAVNSWSKLIGQSLSSTRTLPNLQRNGLPLQVVSWSVKEVSIWIEALGLSEWKPAFEKHRIQGAPVTAHYHLPIRPPRPPPPPTPPRPPPPPTTTHPLLQATSCLR